jgi:hypothetical protein
MKVGRSYKVTLSLVGKKAAELGAIETHLKYDPKKMTIAKLDFGEGMPVEKSQIDSKKGLVDVVVFWNKGEFYAVEPEKSGVVLSFMVTPKEEGDSEVDLITSSEEGDIVTMIVENTSSEQLAFSSNKLEINAIK